MPELLEERPRWTGKAHLVFDYFSCSTVSEVYQKELVDIVGFPFNYKYENLDIFYDQRDIDRHVALLVQDAARIEREMDFIRYQITALLDASREFGDRNDLEAFKAWFSVYRSFLPTLGLVFGHELALDRLVRAFLSEQDVYKIAFAKKTATVEEQRSLLSLARVTSQIDLDEGIREHVRRFSWLGNKMMSETPFTEKQILERIEAARPMAAEALGELDEHRVALEAGARTVFDKVSADQAHFIRLYQDILALRTERADAVCQAARLTHPLFVWIAERLQMTREELLRFSKKEIIEMMETGERKDPTPREKYSMFLINGVSEVMWGSWGKAQEKIFGLEEIRGIIACRGMAEGIVKIINQVTDMQGFQKGDILVASYTNPDLLPVMEKASAIVTNIGGMTSHAAIVSRELNKPCIIGTKIATNALKDGDRVEVDAERGVVRVLKRA